jgi:hypothetical protein
METIYRRERNILMKAAAKRKRTKSGNRKQLAKTAPKDAGQPAQGKAALAINFTPEEVEKYKQVLKHGDMLNHSMGWLLGLVRQKGETAPVKDAADFAFDAFVGLTPNGPGEIMLCQQMIAAYEMAMAMLTRCKQADHMSQMQEFGLMGVKMMGAYERLFQTLMKTRRQQQTVRVEHVTINGGQTVVGNVNQPPALGAPQTSDQIAVESAALRVVEGA